MKVVIQRVKYAELSCENKLISKIEKGLAVYFGVKVGDDKSKCDKIAEKIVNMRIFEDENGKMNLSVKDVGGEILFISQFTLYGDASHGNRPSFTDAERPEKAKPLYDYTLSKINELGVTCKGGVFGGDMKIEQLNDGPTTIVLSI